jgi:hypothetical protein
MGVPKSGSTAGMAVLFTPLKYEFNPLILVPLTRLPADGGACVALPV